VKPAWVCLPAYSEATALPGLSRELGLAEPARFAGHDAHGRPRAESQGTALPVSVSRCGAVCAVALAAGGRVGVDLVDPCSNLPTASMLELASSSERLWLEALPEQARRRRLFQVWACREALLKALGLGLALDLGAVELEPWGEEGLRPLRVIGCPTPPLGWHVAVEDGQGLAAGLILGLAWTT